MGEELQLNSNERNGNWKGDSIGVAGIHAYIKRRLNKPKNCPKCGSNKNIELTCHKHKYSRRLKNWGYLCRSCHSKLDNKIENITNQKHVYYCERCDKMLIDGRRKFCAECRIITRREWWKAYHNLHKEKRNSERRVKRNG